MIGKTVSRFEVVSKLGEGGMGVVYKAWDPLLERDVALKFPSDAMVGPEDMRARFLNEARMAALLLHQNVAALYEIGEADGHLFTVIEYVDGPSLRDHVKKNGPPPIGQCLRLTREICEGLGAVHRKKVLHRDIKTDNILLTKAGQVKIADCGLAARFVNKEGLAVKLGIEGTTSYMSPEQIRGQHLDQRSDIFSVGVVMYEMLTGRLPFEADNRIALQYLIANADPEPLESFRKGIPETVRAIMLRCLEKEPDNRYQTVDELIKDLRRAEEEV